MKHLLNYSLFENYGENENIDEELIRDIFLEYKEKWDIRGDYFDCQNKGRYLLMVEFEKWDEEDDTTITSKVNTSTIDEFRKDMEAFVNRMKKYAEICFLSWIEAEEYHGDYSYPKMTDDNKPIYAGVWIYVDFCTSGK